LISYIGPPTKIIPVCFLVIEAPTSYNVLLGHPSLNTLGVVVSTPHLVMKFPSPSGNVITIHGDQRLARECYITILRPQIPILQTHNIEREPSSSIALSSDDLDPRIGCDSRIKSVEKIVSLEVSPGRAFKLGVGLQQEHRDVLAPTLTANADLFAWSTANLLGVDSQIAAHKLSIYKEARYISQKKRKLGEERRLAAKAEVEKLHVGFIAEHITPYGFPMLSLSKKLIVNGGCVLTIQILTKSAQRCLPPIQH